jgi:hypothetical protein
MWISFLSWSSEIDPCWGQGPVRRWGEYCKFLSVQHWPKNTRHFPVRRPAAYPPSGTFHHEYWLFHNDLLNLKITRRLWSYPISSGSCEEKRLILQIPVFSTLTKNCRHFPVKRPAAYLASIRGTFQSIFLNFMMIPNTQTCLCYKRLNSHFCNQNFLILIWTNLKENFGPYLLTFFLFRDPNSFPHRKTWKYSREKCCSTLDFAFANPNSDVGNRKSKKNILQLLSFINWFCNYDTDLQLGIRKRSEYCKNSLLFNINQKIIDSQYLVQRCPQQPATIQTALFINFLMPHWCSGKWGPS